MLKHFSIIFILAACSIIYEMGFAYGLTLIYGSSVFYYSLTIGIYIFAMGIGTLAYPHIEKYSKTTPFHLFFFNEILLVFIALIAIPLIFFTTSYFPTNYYLNHVISYTFIVAIGILSGIEIPLLNALSKEDFTKLLGVDYFGTLIGTILFSLVLLPNVGLINTMYFTALFNVITILLINYKKHLYMFICGLTMIYIVLASLFFHVDTFFEDLYMKKILYSKEECKDRNCQVEILDNFNTAYQNVVYAQLNYFPINKDDKPFSLKCLYLDKEVQFCNNWFYSYHFHLAQIPINIKVFEEKKEKLDILILGGGDFYAATLINENKNKINSIDHIDIDKQFFNYINDKVFKESKTKLLNDKKYTLIDTDAFAYLLKNQKKYDVIYFDLPILKNEKLLPLYSQEMYSLINKSLKEDGFLVDTYEGVDVFNETTLKKAGFNYNYVYQGKFVGYEKDLEVNKNFVYSDQFVITTKNQLSYDVDILTKNELVEDKTIQINKIFRPNYNYIVKKES